MAATRKIDTVIIYRTDTLPTMGHGRDSTAYHALIHQNGTIELGLSIDQCTRLQHPHWATSLDICLCGRVTTDDQQRSLRGFLAQFMRQFPNLTVQEASHDQPL